MLSDMKFIEVKYSRVPMPVRIIITCLAMSVLIASGVLFFILADMYWRTPFKYAWVIAVGWAVVFVVMLFFNSPERRLLVKMFKGLVSISKWNAGVWLMKAFLWYCVYTYGVVFSLAVCYAYAPIGCVKFAITG